MIPLKKFFLHHRKLAITLTVIICVVLVFFFMCLSTYIPKVEDTDYSSDAAVGNPYIVENTLLSAHRAGRFVAPENTMAAFKACLENNNSYSVDILEFDLHLTADDDLILLHDDTLDRTSDCRVMGEKNVRPRDKTVGELKQYNMGYNFLDPVTNEYIYRKPGANLDDCRIVTLRQVLTYLTGKDAEGKKYRFIIEIKNGGDEGFKAAEILRSQLVEFNLLDRTVVGTFHGEVSKYLDEHCPEIIRSAGIAEVLDFYFSCMFNVDLAKKGIKYRVLQIPYKDYVINLGKKSIIDYAHKYGIAVQYWTINKEKDIRHLAEIGADAVITDAPDLAYDVLNKVVNDRYN